MNVASPETKRTETALTLWVPLPPVAFAVSVASVASVVVDAEVDVEVSTRVEGTTGALVDAVKNGGRGTGLTMAAEVLALMPRLGLSERTVYSVLVVVLSGGVSESLDVVTSASPVVSERRASDVKACVPVVRMRLAPVVMQM